MGSGLISGIKHFERGLEAGPFNAVGKRSVLASVSDPSTGLSCASESEPCCTRRPLAETLPVAIVDENAQPSDPFAGVGVCALTRFAAVGVPEIMPAERREPKLGPGNWPKCRKHLVTPGSPALFGLVG